MGSKDAHSGSQGPHSISLAVGTQEEEVGGRHAQLPTLLLSGRVMHSRFTGTQETGPGI